MASKYFSPRKLTPMQKAMWQLSNIRKTYGNVGSSCWIKNGFKCILNITPSCNSDTYKIEISYRYGYRPIAKLISPKIEKRDGKLPHHIYGVDENGYAILCVYHPDYDEWNNNVLISKSFIPWISTWLITYEFWLITGEWYYDEIINGQEKTIKDGGKCDTTN